MKNGESVASRSTKKEWAYLILEMEGRMTEKKIGTNLSSPLTFLHYV